MNNLDKAGSEGSFGCFHTVSKRILKRKHVESEENETKPVKKSLLSTIGEKLGLTRPHEKPQRSILSPTNRRYPSTSGNMNLSYEHVGYSSYVTNMERDQEHDFPPKKRVKFDEENLIVSSITYQRQQSEARQFMIEQPRQDEDKSFFNKIIDFTANLF